MPVVEYAENQQRLSDWAVAHDADLVTLAPCSRLRLAGGEHPWDPWFEAMEAAGALAHVDACSVLREQGLSEDEAFLDELHPTAVTNEAYAEALAVALVEAGWPARQPDIPHQ